MRSMGGLKSKDLELKNGTLLNINRRNSNRLAKGLQCCACGGGAVAGVCVFTEEISHRSQGCVKDFSALSKLGNEGWETPAQIRQQHTILGLI